MSSSTRNASGNPDRAYDEADLSSRAFWSMTMDERDETFAVLREERPVTWHEPFEDQLLEDPEDYGFWAVVTHEDLIEVTKRHEEFLSGHGILLESLPPEILESSQSIIAMDPPRHKKMRRLVSSAFTARQMRRIEDHIADNARMVVDNLFAKAEEADDGVVDFVDECAALLPMHNINDIMGVPDGDRQKAAEEAASAVGWNDPDVIGSSEKDKILERLFAAQTYVHDLGTSLAEQRREDPQDDVITKLVEAEVDDEKLTDDEIGAFFVLLTIAGNDTTRQSTSHGLKALTDHPDQRDWLLEDMEERMPDAVEELVRWATPIMTFRRTAAEDVEFRGQEITAGDKVVLFYSSANRDGSAIDRPHELDLARNPNPHVSFGGGGIHQCLGNQLARYQLRALFTELLTRAPKIEAIEDPVLVPGNFFHQVKRLRCRLNLED